MEKWKKRKECLKAAGKKIIFPPPFLSVLLAAASFGLVFWVLYKEISGSALAYTVYFFSAYGLFLMGSIAHRYLRVLGRWLKRFRFWRRFREDIGFRTEIFLYFGLVFNLVYSVLKLYMGLTLSSAWLITYAAYYIILFLLRFYLLYSMDREKGGRDKVLELKRYRVCGICLLALNQAMVVMEIYIVHQNKGVTYPGTLIYAVAAYAFYRVAAALVSILSLRKSGRPVLFAVKMINLAAALVSILSMETAMLDQFGGEDPVFRRWMTGISGAAMCTLVLGIAVRMIFYANRELKKMEV